jgi:hypothetical protein
MRWAASSTVFTRKPFSPSLICRRMPPTFPPTTAAPFHIASATLGLHSVEQYQPLIGAEATERIVRKAERLRLYPAFWAIFSILRDPRRAVPRP